jgi:hypothetical protein
MNSITDNRSRKIGELVASLSSQLSSARELTIVPVEDSSQVPAIFVRETDRDIPERVVSWWYEGIAKPIPVLRRSLREDERITLERRRRDLLIALAAPADGHHGDRCAGAVAGMLAGFPAMSRHDIKAATAMVAGYLSIVGDLPPWAIMKASRMVRSGQAGLNMSFCPSEPEFCGVVKRIVAPYEERRRKIDALLLAEAPAKTQRKALPHQPGDIPVRLTRDELQRQQAEEFLAHCKAEAEATAKPAAAQSVFELDPADWNA